MRVCVCRVDVAHLSLYNLSVIYKKKYFDSELKLMTYINDNWDLLQLGKVLNTHTSLHLKYTQTSHLKYTHISP